MATPSIGITQLNRRRLVAGRFRFVRMPPHVHQTNRSMETVEHFQRQRNMIQHVPQNVAVKLVPANATTAIITTTHYHRYGHFDIGDTKHSPLVAGVVGFHRERVEQPQRHVRNR